MYSVREDVTVEHDNIVRSNVIVGVNDFINDRRGGGLTRRETQIHWGIPL